MINLTQHALGPLVSRLRCTSAKKVHIIVEVEGEAGSRRARHTIEDMDELEKLSPTAVTLDRLRSAIGSYERLDTE